MGSSNYDPEDSFISDDEEELCPLCVEEMDISDKNFKPCPCGYQVCQFCYNNIRQNPQLNGKCPACRRPYDDESVEYRAITTEEWKQDHAKQARRERERKQREREKKETEQTSKKHLSGMRVIQKNLVYVIGLNPSIPTEELHHTLRTDQFFGQYGKIQKIVINRRNNSNGNPGLGVYVTFSRKEDAARCIAAVDGSINDGKYLRAAYGTTKYCSSYLRGQACPNPNCMFLHEPGEEADSYTRQDLSTIQHAARQGIRSSKSTKAYHNADQEHYQSSSSSHTASDNHHIDQASSALPASVSWATKASPSVANIKIQQPSFPPLPVAKPVVVPPVVVPPKQEVPIVPQREPPILNSALRFMEESLEMLSATKFDYKFSQDILTSQHLSNSLPLFAFSNKCTNTITWDSELPPYVFTSISLSTNNSKPESFRGFSSNDFESTPTQQAPIVLNAQAMPRFDNIKTSTPPPPPPPGLFGIGNGNSTQSQNSQELLAHLMKRDSSDEPISLYDTSEAVSESQPLVTDLLDVESLISKLLNEVEPLNTEGGTSSPPGLSKEIKSHELNMKGNLTNSISSAESSCNEEVKVSSPAQSYQPTRIDDAKFVGPKGNGYQNTTGPTKLENGKDKRSCKINDVSTNAKPLTRRQRKKLEQQQLLEESIRVRQESQFISRREREHTQGEEEPKSQVPEKVILKESSKLDISDEPLKVNLIEDEKSPYCLPQSTSSNKPPNKLCEENKKEEVLKVPYQADEPAKSISDEAFENQLKDGKTISASKNSHIEKPILITTPAKTSLVEIIKKADLIDHILDSHLSETHLISPVFRDRPKFLQVMELSHPEKALSFDTDLSSSNISIDMLCRLLSPNDLGNNQNLTLEHADLCIENGKKKLQLLSENFQTCLNKTRKLVLPTMRN